MILTNGNMARYFGLIMIVASYRQIRVLSPPEELEELTEKYNEEEQKRIDSGDKFAKVLDMDKVLNERRDYDSYYDSYWDTERSSLEAYTMDDWYARNGDLETYSRSFTSPSGDEMVAFGAFGYDG